MKNYKTIIAAVATGLVCTVTSQATLTGDLTPIYAPIGAGAYVPTGGSIIATLSSPYTFLGNVGTLKTEVYSGDTSNPLAGLDFIYTLTLTAGDFTGITVDGFFGKARISNGSLANAQATTAEVTFGNLNYGFGGGQLVVNSPSQVVIVTDAKTYGGNIGNIQDGGSVNVNILAPVPEPTTVIAGALLLLPLGASTLRVLRKNRTA